ncbi:MAG: polymerase family exonuclease domain, partial [Acidimicrobiales bacterium]|nr:polymerase family exonuclease domain [Acidimicrobiales bacterium]
MGQHANIYGLDIETDTRHDGLDPAVARIVTIALSGTSFDDLYIGDEATMLASLDARLATLDPGVLATWNGATFDLPFIAERARLLGVDLQLQLCLDRRLTLGR